MLLVEFMRLLNVCGESPVLPQLLEPEAQELFFGDSSFTLLMYAASQACAGSQARKRLLTRIEACDRVVV